MSKFVCPICGKGYDDAGALAICVSNCASELDKKSNELEIARSEVEAALENLTTAIGIYNGLSANDEYSINLNLSTKDESKIGSKTTTIKHERKNMSELESLLEDAFDLKTSKTLKQKSTKKPELKKIPDSPAMKSIQDLMNKIDYSDEAAKLFNEMIDDYNSLDDSNKKAADTMIPIITGLFEMNPNKTLRELENLFK